MNIEVLIPLAFFAAVFGVLYVYFTTRNKERLAMIEKGADPNIFASKRKESSIKLGMLAIGAAIGIVVGQVVSSLFGMDHELATGSMVLLFAGLSLVLHHLLFYKNSSESE